MTGASTAGASGVSAGGVSAAGAWSLCASRIDGEALSAHAGAAVLTDRAASRRATRLRSIIMFRPLLIHIRESVPPLKCSTAEPGLNDGSFFCRKRG